MDDVWGAYTLSLRVLQQQPLEDAGIYVIDYVCVILLGGFK